MGDAANTISAIAAVLSAIGGGIACVAAFKSAKHAKDTFDSSQLAEKRMILRQLNLTAHEISVEVDRVKWVAQGLKVSYKTLFTFSGQANGSRECLFVREIDSKLQEADRLLERAEPFTIFIESLLNGPAEEISSREILLAKNLAEARAIREKLEIELRSIESQNQAFQERAISGKG